MSATTFLSSQGYSILKSSLNENELHNIRNELTVAPHIGGDFANITPPKKFKLYTDGPTKIYVPKHYGLKKFGKPGVSRVQEGVPVDITFQGSLRKEQEPAIQAYIDAIRDDTKQGGLLNLTCASGKCLGINTPILMYDGSIKKVQDVQVGEKLMGDDNTPRNVLSVCKGRSILYKVHQASGMSYVVNKDHILSLLDTRTNKIVDMPVTKYVSLSEKDQNTYMGIKSQPTFEHLHHDHCLDPYVAGMICAQSSRSIPHYYRAASKEVMVAFIEGFMHTNGRTISQHHKHIRTCNKSVACSLHLMLTCVGYGCYIHQRNDIEGCVVHVYTDELSIKTHFKYPIKVTRQQYGSYFGFEIDGNRRFLLGDCTITHNTVMAIYLMCYIKRKTLVVVHKDFLLQQWKERIEQFCPTAKVGLIKASVIDVEDKDIVIGSLQSLSMKTYDDQVFKDFGFVVVDEVHHTSAEVFCRALRKISFKYTLGLSATIKRKDGLSKVFMWYLGDILYSNVKKTSRDVVHIKLLKFFNEDAEYSEEVYLRGNKVLNVAKMINNICEFLPRTTHVIEYLDDLLTREPERRVIVLSDRRGHLEQIGTLLSPRNISYGLYLGGMKPDELKQSEKQQVILGTYHMVSEGFDCKSLDTLFLVSPKSDVIQSVGRILREEASKRRHVPLVVDVIDQFSIFERQASKRIAYYKKQKYTFIDVENEKDIDESPSTSKSSKLVQLNELRLVALE